MQLMFPQFLVGLLAVAIPVVIHLLQLRRPKRILFTNTAFIREVELVTVRHRKLQHLAILLARALGICALVIAFCQPFRPSKHGVSIANAAGIDVLVDNSYSMQLWDATAKPLLEDALARARELGQFASRTAKFRILDSGNKIVSRAEYLNQLDELKFNAHHRIGEYVSVIGEGNNPLYIFSDFQKSAFNSAWFDQIGARQAVLVPLVGKKAGNAFVDSVWLDDAFVRVNVNTILHMRIRNGGEANVNQCPVKVFLGNKQVAAFRVNVGAGMLTSTTVQVRLNDKALALGRVVVEDSPVTFDNTYYFTLQPASTIKVLEIGDEPVLQQVYGNEPLFAYAFAEAHRIDYGALRQANLVLVHELTEIDAGLRDGLQAVLKRGGSVVIVPSSSTAAHESYQRLFSALGLGTVQWEGATATPEMREVVMPSTKESFFRDVFGAQQRAVTMPRAAPVLRWSRTGTDILRLRDGESYLAGFASGTGQVYVFSAPFSREYSDFTEHALFVPVMYRMAMLSYRNDQLPAYHLNQGTIRLQLPSEYGIKTAATGQTDEAGFRLLKDSLKFIPAQRVLGNEVRLDVPLGMETPGFYQVQRQGKVLTTLAFNMDRRESELAAYSADELRQLIGPNRPNIRVVEGGVDGTGLAALRAEQTGQPLWRYFLLAALLCLLAEALLVRFGNLQARVRRPRATA